MTIGVDDLLRVSARLTLAGGQDMVNVWHIGVGNAVGADDQETLDDVLELLEGGYNAWLAELSDEVAFNDVTIYVEGQEDSFPPQAWPSLTVGGNVATPMPAGVCLLALLSTGRKRVVGRKYLGGFTEDDWDAAGWSTTVQGTVATGLDHFIAGITGINGTELALQVWSPTLATSFNISSYRLLANSRYQRRRRPGAGS